MFKLRSILMLPGFEIPPTSQKIAKKRIFKKVDFQKKLMKNGSEPISIYSFSRRIRIRIQNWTKTGPKPDFDQFSKNYVFFIKNPDFYEAAASAARPFLINLSCKDLLIDTEIVHLCASQRAARRIFAYVLLKRMVLEG